MNTFKNLFEGFTDIMFCHLVPYMRIITLSEEGETLFQENSSVDQIYFIM
jgi:hypothetical protein